MILNKHCKFNFSIEFVIYFTLSINDFYYDRTCSTTFFTYNAWFEWRKSEAKFYTDF